MGYNQRWAWGAACNSQKMLSSPKRAHRFASYALLLCMAASLHSVFHVKVAEPWMPNGKGWLRALQGTAESQSRVALNSGLYQQHFVWGWSAPTQSPRGGEQHLVSVASARGCPRACQHWPQLSLTRARKTALQLLFLFVDRSCEAEPGCKHWGLMLQRGCWSAWQLHLRPHLIPPSL